MLWHSNGDQEIGHMNENDLYLLDDWQGFVNQEACSCSAVLFSFRDCKLCVVCFQSVTVHDPLKLL